MHSYVCMCVCSMHEHTHTHMHAHTHTHTLEPGYFRGSIWSGKAPTGLGVGRAMGREGGIILQLAAVAANTVSPTCQMNQAEGQIWAVGQRLPTLIYSVDRDVNVL